jgi:hypothetical protein
MDAGLIDVRQLIKDVSVEEFCRGAEEFFAQRINWSSLQAKPFSEINETPELLTCFVQVVPPPGKYVLHCDLFSETVCWFEHNGSLAARFAVEVI